MGKRTSNLAGVSRFLHESLTESATNPNNEKSSSISENPIAVANNAAASRQDNAEDRPKKRRKKGPPPLPGRSRYDATGLVPHYRNALQVPDHLQKCMYPGI